MSPSEATVGGVFRILATILARLSGVNSLIAFTNSGTGFLRAATSAWSNIESAMHHFAFARHSVPFLPRKCQYASVEPLFCGCPGDEIPKRISTQTH